MLKKINQKSISQLTLVLIFSMFCLWSIPVFAGTPQGGNSPEAVFKAAQKASANKDFSTLTNLVAPSEHAMMAFGTDFGVGMIVEFFEGEKAAALKKKYEKIQKKYKVKDLDDDKKLKITQDTPQEVIDEHMRKRATKKFGHVDAMKYVPELLGLVMNMPEMAGRSIVPQEKLTDLKIKGNHATGKAGDEDVSFIREGGRWYLTGEIMD